MAALGDFEQLLLFAVLRLGEGAYGVPIRKEIEASTGRVVAAGAVYTGLDRLENRGLVASRVGEPTAQRGGRRKKFYDVTPAGAQALNASYQTIQRMAAGVGTKLAELAAEVSEGGGSAGSS